MQNRKQHDLTLGELISLDISHTKLHNAEAMIQFQEALEGETMETALVGAVVDMQLEAVHAHMKSHSVEEIKAANEQLQRVTADIAAKKRDVGSVIAAKNEVRESFAKAQGVFAKSASNSDTEEVSSLEVSPVSSPRL